MLDITCVVNAHCESHLLTPTIRSVQRAQRYADSCGLKTQLMVVLDRSDEDTKSVVEQLILEESLVVEINKGDLALARNEAVELVTSEYIAFLDGDDLWCQSWIVDSFSKASMYEEDVILHPEYNIYFGSDSAHVLRHVDSESERFEFEHIYRQNYWTALSFAKRSIYEKYPYRKNTILDGFGYEDWNWNYETLMADISHKIVKNTAHYIRRGKEDVSLLDKTNSGGAIPRIWDIYDNRVDSIEFLKAA